LSERDGIDIYKAQDYDEVLAFLAKPIPFCKFCAVDKRRYNLEWGLSKKDMCEWVFDDKEIHKEKE
jgi:hypothetical protein